jgi:hypothetical protein
MTSFTDTYLLDRAYIQSVRPNIDIPWSIHGEIKEMAEDRDMNLTDAYVRALRAGLENADTLAGPEENENGN